MIDNGTFTLVEGNRFHLHLMYIVYPLRNIKYTLIKCAKLASCLSRVKTYDNYSEGSLAPRSGAQRGVSGAVAAAAATAPLTPNRWRSAAGAEESRPLLNSYNI